MLTTISDHQLPIDSFQKDLQEICGAFSVEPVKGRDIVRGTVLLEKRVGLEIAHIAKDVNTIRRTKKEVAQDSCEHFFLVIQEEGRAMMAQRDVVTLMQPGDMFLVDSAEPSEFSFFGNYGRQLSVHLSREEMKQRFGEHVSGGRFLGRNDYITIALNAVLAKAFAPHENTPQCSHLREALFGLIGAWLYEQKSLPNSREVNVDVTGAKILRNGIAYIDRLFKDSSFTIQSMAHTLGVSQRQLQRAFATLGTTPTDYLLHKRLEYACQLLMIRRSNKNGLLVSSIAYTSGFNDVSYFNRQFRKHFLCTPGQFGFEKEPDNITS